MSILLSCLKLSGSPRYLQGTAKQHLKECCPNLQLKLTTKKDRTRPFARLVTSLEAPPNASSRDKATNTSSLTRFRKITVPMRLTLGLADLCWMGLSNPCCVVKSNHL